LKSRMIPVLIVLLLTSTPMLEAVRPGEAVAGPRAGWPLRVQTEWESPAFNGSANIIVNDTDTDGIAEIIVWGDFQNGDGDWVNSVLVFKPPTYECVWAANFSEWINNVELADLYQNGSVQLIIGQSGFEATNITVLSGRGYGTVWTSPDMEGNILFSAIEDADADGELEFVWVNTSSVFDGTAFGYESHIQVYGAKSHQNEWSSPAIPQDVSDFQMAQLDADPALEFYLQSYDLDENWSTVNQTVRVYDNPSHSLLMEKLLPDNPSGVSNIYIGDADNDTRGEVLLQADWSESSGVLMYAAGNGSLLWNFTLGNTTDMAAAVDIDSDGAMELLATGSENVDLDNMTFNLTHYLFDLRGRSVAWKAGPLLSDQDGSSVFFPLTGVAGTYPNIFPQMLPGFVLGNITTGMTASTISYDFFDGKTLARLWRSPEFSTIGFGGMDIFCTQADSDPAWEIVIPESEMDILMNFKSRVHLYSDNNFSEEWTSEEYPASNVFGAGLDVLGDKSPELLLQLTSFDITTMDQTSQTLIFDGDNRSLLWTGPKDYSDTGNFSDLYGSPQREIVHIAVNQSPQRTYSSTISVYNDTTYALAWTGGEMKGEMALDFVGDLDSDDTGELVTSDYWEDQDYNSFTNITVREFTERTPQLPDIAVGGQDITFSNLTPVAGMPINITFNVSNIGTLNATGCCVTILMDEQLALETAVDVAMGNMTRVQYNWTAVAGNHTFKVLADRMGLLKELNESNNNASRAIFVGDRPHPVPVISSPAEGQNIPSGTPITFNGTATVFALGGQRSFYWKYDGFAYLGNTSLFNATLPLGPHRVSLHADDGFFNASTSVNVTVGPPKPPPGTTWAVISLPEEGAEFTAGEQIRFDGSQSQAAQAGYTLEYAWSSNRTGPLGVAANFTRALPSGVHNITLVVDDGHGGQSSAHVQVNVKSSTGVVAIISSPVEGQLFDASEPISFDGSRSTGPQGTVLSYVWSSSLAGGLGSEKTFSRKLLAGSHLITLRVSDGQGHGSTDTVSIWVTGVDDLPPTVSIASPPEGAIVSGTVDISGTASDETAVVSVKLKIDNGPWMTADGTANWTFSWNTTTVVNGTYTITVMAADGNHTSQEMTVNLTVDNKPAKPPKPPAKEEFPLAIVGAVLAMVVILVVALAAVLLLRSRRKEPPTYNVVEDSRGVAPPRM